MNRDAWDDTGKLILRWALGLLVLSHGLSKLFGSLDGIRGMLASYGLPEVLVYGVLVGEVLAPLLLLAGVLTRVGGALVVVNMLVAIVLAHRPELLSMNDQGGWALELQGMFLFTGLALVFLGSGRYAIRPD